MKKQTIVKGVAALAGGLLIAGGIGAPAFAADNTTGHADVVAINSSGTVGTQTDANGFSAWSSSSFNESFTFDTSTGDPAFWSCANGVYTFENDHEIEDTLPYVGFENETAGVYQIGVTSSGSSKSAAINTDIGSVSTSGSKLNLPASTHKHGELVLDIGTGSCATPATGVDFNLTFSAKKTAPPVSTVTKTITFTVID